MIERRATWGYWFFNDHQLWGPRRWQLTRLHIDNWVSFDCFHYRINGVIYKKWSKEFERVRNSEIMWEKLK